MKIQIIHKKINEKNYNCYYKLLCKLMKHLINSSLFKNMIILCLKNSFLETREKLLFTTHKSLCH